MGLSKAVVKNRVLILMIALILLVPAVFGMLGTRINYDMLDYLPSDMDTVIGQETLKEDFGKGAFSFIVVQDMPVQEVAQLKEKIQQVDHVESVLWYDSVADLSIPMELLPDKLYHEFNTDDATMLAVFFDSATSEDVTMDAIREIRSIAGKQCFVSGMSALVTDLKDLCEQEEPIYVALAVACACAAMMLLLDGWLVPFVFLASIGMAIVYNLGSNFFLGEISYITKALSAVLQLAVTMDYSIFLWHSYNEQLTLQSDHKEAMAVAIHNTFTSVIGSSATTIAGFIALCFMSFTLGRDLGIVMAKGVLLGVVSTGQAGDDGDLAGLAADLDVLGSFHDAGFLLAEQDLVDLVADAELIGKAIVVDDDDAVIGSLADDGRQRGIVNSLDGHGVEALGDDGVDLVDLGGGVLLGIKDLIGPAPLVTLFLDDGLIQLVPFVVLGEGNGDLEAVCRSSGLGGLGGLSGCGGFCGGLGLSRLGLRSTGREGEDHDHGEKQCDDFFHCRIPP